MNKKLISFKELSEKLSSKELRNVTGGSYAGGIDEDDCNWSGSCSYDTICFSGGSVGWCRWVEYNKLEEPEVYYGGGACRCIQGSF